MSHGELNPTMRDYDFTLNNYLNNWFRKEFNQSLLLSFGIIHITQEQKFANDSLIHIYRNFAQYQNDPSRFSMPKTHMQKFESIQEVRNQISYFGLDNQHKILLNLMSLKTCDSLVKDLYKNQC